MFLSTQQLYNLIRANNYKSARIYEGQNVDFNNEMAFESIFKSSNEDLINRIKELETFLSGDFTVILGTGRKTEPIRQGKKVNVRFVQQVEIIQPEKNTINGFQTYETTENINDRIQTEVNRILKEKEQEQEIESYKSKIQELDSWSGKLNYLLTQFLNSYLQQLKNVPQMNGQAQTVNGSIDTEQLDMALAVLVKYIGSENIIKFSHKIKNGQADGVKPIILQFINS